MPELSGCFRIQESTCIYAMEMHVLGLLVKHDIYIVSVPDSGMIRVYVFTVILYKNCLR